MGFNPSNIQQIGGANRDETSLMIAKILNYPEVFLVSDENFYDSLTVSSNASADTLPMSIILVSPKGFTVNGEKDYLDTKYMCVEGALGNSITSFYPRAKTFPNTMFGGTDEYSDAKYFSQNIIDGGSTIFLATGEDYPDALTGALLASFSQNGMPVILTQHDSLPPEMSNIINQITFFNKEQHFGLTKPINANLVVWWTWSSIGQCCKSSNSYNGYEWYSRPLIFHNKSLFHGRVHSLPFFI